MTSKTLLLKLTTAIILAGLILIILSCAVNPVTGKREIMLLSESDEIQLGKQTDGQVVQSYGLYDDPDLGAYLNNIGNRMAKLSHRPNLKFEFRLLDSPVINAFAVPGGYVYITRGILAYLNNEAELAGVMGHEIGHVAARHSAKQYTKAQMAQVGLGLGVVLSEKFRKFANIAQFGVQLLFLRFSRDAERQADRLGVEYSTKAGYDSREMANFFGTLERMHPSQDQSGLPGWFSTHPNPADRVVAVRKMAEEWQQKSATKKWEVDRDRFLREIDGIVFGDDPKQGYIEKNVFYHPGLTFQFPVPANWKLNNTPEQVQIFSPQQDAVIIFTLAQGTPADAAKKFVSDSKAVVLRSENISVNSLPAYRLITNVASDQGNLRVMSYFIQKQQNTYLFHGFTAQAKFNTYQSTFQRTMNGFRNLTDRRKINVKPDRLKITRAKRAGSLQKILTDLRVPKTEQEKTALLNGMEVNSRIPANTLIKIVEKGR